MISQDYSTEERPDPISERVGVGMFTDREREMDRLMKWVDLVGQKVGRSRALVSHRRYGKTAIMERLYNRIFRERKDVMPFYFELHDGIHKIWDKKLAELYFYAFVRQYLAYRTRNAELAFKIKHTRESLYEIAENADETYIKELITWWEEDGNISDFIKVHEVMHNLIHDVAVQTGLSIIVMFDEFQRLNRVVYQDEACTHPYERYTDSFSTAAESSRAPMLIAGSEVTALTDEALWGSMLGRVGTSHIGRLPIAGAVQLVDKFAKKHGLDIDFDVAYTISRLVDGHPYYIWCLFNSECLDADLDLTTEKGVKAVLTFEVGNRQGHIRTFWYYHFGHHLETFNLPHARRLIVYLSQYPDKLQEPEESVHLKKLHEDLKLPISIEETNEILQKLIWCDLVWEHAHQQYGGLSDPLLPQVLRIGYSWEIDQIERQQAVENAQAEWAGKSAAYYEEIIDKLRSELNYWVGHVGEVFIKKFMAHHFKDQVVKGADYFNQPRDIQLTRFTRLYATSIQPYGAPSSSQIDIYATPANVKHLPWVVEVKNWQSPVSKPTVVHFWEAAQNLAEEKGHMQDGEMAMVCWFHARSGFTGPARDFLKEKGILNTDGEALTKMLRKFEVIEKWRESEELTVDS